MTGQSHTPPPELEIRIEGSTGWLVIANEKRRNAMTLEMWRTLPAAVSALEAERDVRAIILRGAGSETFCAGADISEFEETRKNAKAARAYEDINLAAFEALKACRKPVIAMIRGHCLGGGFGLAASCDLRLASHGSSFGIPAARLGIAYPPAALMDVAALIGPARTRELIFTARRIEAGEALHWGFLNQLLEDSALEAAARKLAAMIAQNAALTHAATKAALIIPAGHSAPDFAKAEAAAIACFDSADFAEGRTAFLEKRTPEFKGA
ncbi:enoyl-CoA hydratase [Pannonibacter indicus]|uniref:Enoyl-CoA hydratase/carnithine racemase n=1 Tax=Pannonibacter indicus TaxID=466044 RepID=A0A0K6IAJ9_9HYPH|nr:enoyl-CoA hydratase [Pannonibacter indicus]CUB00063.1 Enoyl-CoA hydratase/carnithine racemase [Pannonibacter indicus]